MKAYGSVGGSLAGTRTLLQTVCGVLALMVAASLWASTNETTSFSPVFVKDAAGKLRTLTWTYAVNGGQALTVPFDTTELGASGDMTFKCGDLSLTIDPKAKTRTALFNPTFTGNLTTDDGESATYSGSASVKVTEGLDALDRSVLVKDQRVVMGLNLSVPGQRTMSLALNLLTQFDPSAEWFLDRSDLDQIDIGSGLSASEEGATTGSVKVTISGYGSETEPVDSSVTVPDQWTVLDQLDRFTVGKVTYRNVIEVERDTEVPSGDLTGAASTATVTYWVAQGVGMVKGVGQFQFMGNPLTIELKSTTLTLPQVQTITFPALPATKRPGDSAFDPLAKASSKLPVTYVSSNEAVAVVTDAGLIEVVGIGTTTITAYQDGNANYQPAAPVSKVLTVKSLIAANPDPASGGKVTGGGLCAPGQKVTLTAQPAKGFTFAHWNDGSQACTCVLTAPSNDDLTVTATFMLTSAIHAPTVTNPGDQSATVGVPFALPLAITSDSLPTVTVSGLPAGLAYNAASRTITGLPTTATPTNKPPVQVKISVVNVANPKAPVTAAFAITVAPLPVWACGTFNGTCGIWESEGIGDDDFGGSGCVEYMYIWPGASDGYIYQSMLRRKSATVSESACSEQGLATMTVTAQGKITGSVSFGGTNYAFSAASYGGIELDDGSFQVHLDAKAGKADLPLDLSVARPTITDATGIVPLTLSTATTTAPDDGYADGSLVVAMYRNVWKDTGMTAKLTPYLGYYTATLPGSDASFGSGYLTLTVDATTSVKTGGKLADGAAVSSSGALILDEAGRLWTVVYMAPTAYQGGGFFGQAEFVTPDDVNTNVVLRTLDGGTFQWNNCDPRATDSYGDGFARQLGLAGGWYDKLINLRAYYADGLAVGGVAVLPSYLATVRTTDWDPDAPARKITTTSTFAVDAAPCLPDGLALAVTPATGAGTGLAAPRVVAPVKTTDPDTGMPSYNYDALANPSGLTISFTRATGIFKGTFNMYYDYVSADDLTVDPERQTWTHTVKSVSYEGALTPVREDTSDGVEGRGFFLWPGAASYPDKPGTYPFNASYDFTLARP